MFVGLYGFFFSLSLSFLLSLPLVLFCQTSEMLLLYSQMQYHFQPKSCRATSKNPSMSLQGAGYINNEKLKDCHNGNPWAMNSLLGNSGFP